MRGLPNLSPKPYEEPQFNVLVRIAAKMHKIQCAPGMYRAKTIVS